MIKEACVISLGLLAFFVIVILRSWLWQEYHHRHKRKSHPKNLRP